MKLGMVGFPLHSVHIRPLQLRWDIDSSSSSVVDLLLLRSAHSAFIILERRTQKLVGMRQEK